LDFKVIYRFQDERTDIIYVSPKEYNKLYTESTLNALGYYEKHGFINKGLIPDESAYDLELELKS
jgi:hypothetical protein